MGKQTAILTGVALIDIHGARFYDLRFHLENSPNVEKTGRIGVESCEIEPKIGEKVRVSLLLGNLVRVEAL